MTALLAGLGLGLSLIIAIGAQNMFVLRQGIRREHVLLVASICAISDAVLIAIGVSGLGALTQANPMLLTVVRWAGAAFLIGYGVLAGRRALLAPAPAPQPDAQTVPMVAVASGPTVRVGAAAAGPAPASDLTSERDAGKRASALGVALTCLALTWLNPHVYLDTVFLLGSVAATHGEARWWFALGAMTGSVLWFFGLAFGARFLGRWLTTPLAARVLDGFIAVVMMILGASLLLPA